MRSTRSSVDDELEFGFVHDLCEVLINPLVAFHAAEAGDGNAISEPYDMVKERVASQLARHFISLRDHWKKDR